jgi:hypothetical protein
MRDRVVITNGDYKPPVIATDLAVDRCDRETFPFLVRERRILSTPIMEAEFG